MLIQVFNYEEPITSISNDKAGTIYMTFPSGLHKLNTQTGKTSLINPEYTGGIFFLEDLFYAVPPLPDSTLLKLGAIKADNLLWLSQLPASDMQSLITVGIDDQNFHYVATTYHVYKFKVSKAFRKALSIYSVRGILEWHDTMFFNTYAGLYQNQKVIDPMIQGGDLTISRSGDLIASSGRFLYRVANAQTELITPDSLFFSWATERSANIIAIYQKPNQNWLIGTDRGLVIAEKDSISFFLPGITIEEIREVSDGVILSTSTGIIHLSASNQFSSLDVPALHYNQTITHGSKLYIASDNGLYMYDGEAGYCNPVNLAPIQEDLQIVTMVKDNFGYLWCGTNDGLYQVDLSTHNSKKYLNTIEFNKRSRYVKDQLIYMGSTKGVFYWDASVFSSTQFNPEQPSLLTSMKRQPLAKTLLIILLLLSALGASGFYWYKSRRKKDMMNAPSGDPSPHPDAGLPLEVRVNRFIEQNISTVTVETLAEHLGIGIRELYREIKRLYQKTPGQLIREYRKDLVLKILEENPEESITTLAAQVGYSERHVMNIIGNDPSESQSKC